MKLKQLHKLISWSQEELVSKFKSVLSPLAWKHHIRLFLYHITYHIHTWFLTVTWIPHQKPFFSTDSVLKRDFSPQYKMAHHAHDPLDLNDSLNNDDICLLLEKQSCFTWMTFAENKQTWHFILPLNLKCWSVAMCFEFLDEGSVVLVPVNFISFI